MEFHEYESLFEATLADIQQQRGKVAAKKFRDLGWFYFHEEFLTFMEKNPAVQVHLPNDSHQFTERNRIRCEGNWYACHKPYYKIWPDYVTMLSSTSLNIPVDMMRLPTPSFEVRFPKGHEIKCGHITIRSFLLSEIEMKEAADAPLTGRLFLMITDAMLDVAGVPTPYKYTISLATGDRFIKDGTLEQYLTMAMFKAEGMDEVYPNSKAEFVIVIDQCWRVGLSVCFLATGSEHWIDPDVLNKDFNAYLEAVNKKDEATVTRLRTRATDARHQVGYTLGKSEALLGRRAWDVDTSTRTHKDGSPLKYRHIRNAHPHVYWVGTGDQRRPERRFMRMLIIRPDLPIDPRPKGHRTLRKKQEMETPTCTSPTSRPETPAPSTT